MKTLQVFPGGMMETLCFTIQGTKNATPASSFNRPTAVPGHFQITQVTAGNGVEVTGKIFKVNLHLCHDLGGVFLTDLLCFLYKRAKAKVFFHLALAQDFHMCTFVLFYVYVATAGLTSLIMPFRRSWIFTLSTVNMTDANLAVVTIVDMAISSFGLSEVVELSAYIHQLICYSPPQAPEC